MNQAGFGALILLVLGAVTSVVDAFLEHSAHHTNVGSKSACDRYCNLGDDCWPSTQEIGILGKSLDGEIVLPTDPLYRNFTFMKNIVQIRIPGLIVMAKSTADVQKSVLFGKRYNLKISIQSSGHDYIGRSINHGGMLIGLNYMQDIKINLNSTRNPAGEITLESGNYWERVYLEVDKVNRVVVGGSAHTVAIGGYTLGGGHSPICRKLGLAVDSLLEVELVTADGSVVIADAHGTKLTNSLGQSWYNNNTDLFWALRGGGGGTFGVATKFTFKMHYAPNAMVRLSCAFPMYYGTTLVGIDDLKHFTDILRTTLAPEWGGYVSFAGTTSPQDPLARGYGLMFLNHFGEWGSKSFETIRPFLNAMKGKAICGLKNRTSFWDYETEAKDKLYYRLYIMNSFTQNSSFTDQFFTGLVKRLFSTPRGARWGCTGTLIGGNMNIADPDSTAVNPAFRSGLMSLTCGLTWSGDGSTDDDHVKDAENFVNEFVGYGKGSYLNEASAYLPNWKTDYWGNHYDKLLRVKNTLDPDNLFTCHHCVGSDQ